MPKIKKLYIIISGLKTNEISCEFHPGKTSALLRKFSSRARYQETVVKSYCNVQCAYCIIIISGLKTNEISCEFHPGKTSALLRKFSSRARYQETVVKSYCNVQCAQTYQTYVTYHVCFHLCTLHCTVDLTLHWTVVHRMYRKLFNLVDIKNIEMLR